MNLLNSPLPNSAIAAISSTMAHLYRIVPVSLHGGRLTVASPGINQSLLEELQVFLGLTVRSITVAEDDFEHALNRYYPEPTDVPSPGTFCIHPYTHPRESELKELCKRILHTVSDPGIERVSVQCTGCELQASIRRDGEEEGTECVADDELGLLLITRLKVMAGLDICKQGAQTGKIELTDRSVLVEMHSDEDVHIMDLSFVGSRVQNGG